MEQPNAPYLFFIGVGDYAVIKDSYKGKEVSYYVEKEYAPVARGIFGYTPEMMALFSRLTGVEYPWAKYAQITGQDYVSGAMENTTSTLHGSSAQQDARELKDGNAWESVIAHELFHHWFGDYVTSESWSNLTLNESFANYSEILWFEHKYGKDAAEAHNYNDMRGYINSGSSQKDLVRYYYADREDMFDAVSYNKGGRILHMLRNFVGDSAFFASLHLYLTSNALKSAEADQLRLAFEEVTGKDLHWFFNQWYFGSGHPQLAIYYDYDDSSKMVQVNIRQTQEGNKVFRLPLAIDIYEGKEKKRYQVWATQRSDTFRFSYNKMPDLVNVDAEKVLLAEKKDLKNLSQFYHQYLYAGNYLDRREAIEFAALVQKEALARELLKKGLQDPYKGIRNLVLNKLDMENDSVRILMEPLIEEMAKKEKDPVTRATAISQLASFQKEKYLPIFREALYDSSYSVAGASLEGLFALNEKEAMEFIQKTSGQKTKGKLLDVTVSILMRSGNPDDFSTIADTYGAMGISQSKFDLTQPFCQLIARIQDTEKVKKGIALIIAFRDAIPEQFGITPAINSLLEMIIKKKEEMKKTAIDKSAYQEQIDLIRKAIGK
jgi:aminopeptidase N